MPQGPEFIRCDYPNPLPMSILAYMTLIALILCGSINKIADRTNGVRRSMLGCGCRHPKGTTDVKA